MLAFLFFPLTVFSSNFSLILPVLKFQIIGHDFSLARRLANSLFNGKKVTLQAEWIMKFVDLAAILFSRLDQGKW